MCDRENQVLFTFFVCIVTNLNSRFLVLTEHRHKNNYKVDIMSLPENKLMRLSVWNDDSLLWHKHLGHASFSLLNQFVRKDLLLVLSKSKFTEDKVCDACAKGKHVKSSLKLNKLVSTSRPLELLHMNLCGPIKVQSKYRKRYLFFIVADYSRYTRTLFLASKYETYDVFVVFIKKLQREMDSQLADIKFGDDIEFDNASSLKYYVNHDIHHTFLHLGPSSKIV